MKPKRYVLAMLAALIAMMLAGCGAKSDPEPFAQAFFEAYASGDSDTAASLVSGYTAFDIGGAQDSEYHSLMTGLLRDNFSANIRSVETSRSAARAQVEITFFDFRALSGPLEQALTDEAMARKGMGEEPDSEDEIISLLCEVVRSMTEDVSPYISTETVTVNMRRSGDEWLIVPDDALLEILMGYAG